MQGWPSLVVFICLFLTYVLEFLFLSQSRIRLFVWTVEVYSQHTNWFFFPFCHCLQVRLKENLAWFINSIKSCCVEFVQRAVALKSIFCSSVRQKFFTLWKSIFKHLRQYKFLSKALHNSVIPLCGYSVNTYWLTEFLTLWGSPY